MSALSLEAINDLLASTRKRGIYEPRLSEFVESGELAIDFTALPEFSKMDVMSVRNSVKQNIDKHTKENEWPKLQVVVDRKDKDNPRVVVINLDGLAEATAEVEAEEITEAA
jgi:hypothetical protein